MPALQITATDHTTGQLTIPAHGLNTADGACGLIAAGGALPAGGALVEGSDYWVIRIDANTIKLADSNAHALTGTALPFTDNGSGQMYLLIGLPYRVPRIAAPGTQVFSADTNATWQAIAGAKRPVIRRNIPLTPTFIDSSNTWAQTGGGIKSTATAGTAIAPSYIDCPYDVGDQILGIEVYRKSDGTAGTKGALLQLTASVPGGATFSIALDLSDSVASGATTRAMLVVPAGGDVGHVMAAGEKLEFAFVGATNTGYIIDCAQLVVMRP